MSWGGGTSYYIGKKKYTNAQKVWALDLFAPHYAELREERKTRSPFRDAFMLVKEPFEAKWGDTIEYRTFYDWHYNEAAVRLVGQKIADGDRREVDHERMLETRQNEDRVAVLRMQDALVHSLWADR